MDCAPTCTKPMTGTSVPRNQNQPKASQLFRRSSSTASAEKIRIISSELAMTGVGQR